MKFAYHLADEWNVSWKSAEVKVTYISSEIKHWLKILCIYLKVSLHEFTDSQFYTRDFYVIKIIYNMDSHSTLISKSFIALGNAKHLLNSHHLAPKISTVLQGTVKVKMLISLIDTTLFDGKRTEGLVCIAT